MDATTSLNDDDVINYSQAAEVFAACSAIMMLINSSAATNKTLRMLYCILQHSLKLICSLEDDSKRLKTKKKTRECDQLKTWKCTRCLSAWYSNLALAYAFSIAKEPSHLKTGKYLLTNGSEVINSNDLHFPSYLLDFLIRLEY
jgi:hypothetical protein